MRLWRKPERRVLDSSFSPEVQKVAAAFGINPSEAAELLANSVQRLICQIAEETGRDPGEIASHLFYGPPGGIT